MFYVRNLSLLRLSNLIITLMYRDYYYTSDVSHCEGYYVVCDWLLLLLLRSAIYEGLRTCRLKCLGRVMRTASRLVGCVPRFGRVSGYMRDVLHWLSYLQRIFYRISALVRLCIEGLTPRAPCIRELCCSTVTIQRRTSLRSSAQAELLVPRTRDCYRAFSMAGPTSWNGLPVALRLTPVAHYALFLSAS